MANERKKRQERQGMSLRAACLTCAALLAAGAALLIWNENLAAHIGLAFNILMAGALAAYLTHFILHSLVDRIARGRRLPRLRDIDGMSGEEFEAFCARYLARLGFEEIRGTGRSADQGTDLIAGKEGVRYSFQCKRYDSHVGNKAVQEAYAGMAHYGCDVAVVITNSYFTPAARKLAETTAVLLWDRDFLLAHGIGA